MSRRFSLTIPENDLGECQIECKNVSVSIRKSKKEEPVTVLSDINTVFEPGQMVAIMGSSGAGKTSLLNVLTGYLPSGATVFGEVLVNGTPRNSKTWPASYGYVRQFETFYEHLTVLETLEFAANMKMKRRGFTSWETKLLKKDRIHNIMAYLGLDVCKERQLKEISGGERRRVSIALELITEPPIVFLDEPTSGLDGTTAFTILELLRDIAKIQRKTIILSIHQPKFSTLLLFDKLLLLSRGQIVYDGSINYSLEYFKSMGYETPINENPVDHYIGNPQLTVELITVDTRTPEAKSESLERIEYLTSKWDEFGVKPPSRVMKHAVKVEEKKAGILFQFSRLVSRYMRETIRDRDLMISVVVQICVFTLVFGLVFLQLGYSQSSIQSRTGCIIYVIVFVYYGIAFQILGQFPLEMNIIRRERASRFYGGIASFSARFISLLPVFAGVYLTSTAIVYWMIGFNPIAGRYFIFLLFILSLLINATSIGLLMASLTGDVKTALSAGPAVLFVFIIFGGNFANFDTIPVWIAWMQWLSPIQYAFKGLSQNEYTGLTFECDPALQACVTTGEQVLQATNLQSPGVWVNFILLNAFSVFFILLGALTLSRKTAARLNVRSVPAIESDHNPRYIKEIEEGDSSSSKIRSAENLFKSEYVMFSSDSPSSKPTDGTPPKLDNDGNEHVADNGLEILKTAEAADQKQTEGK